MPASYHEGSRWFQDRFDTRRLADRIDERLVDDVIADAEGYPTCSYKGGEPGFVRVLDEHTIAFPNYDGNGMYLSMGNLRVNPNVGLLFIDFERRRRMRLEGVASIDEHDPLIADYPEAQFVVRVRATRVYPNCPRYIHQMQLVERSRFVPKSECETPIPK